MPDPRAFSKGDLDVLHTFLDAQDALIPILQPSDAFGSRGESVAENLDLTGMSYPVVIARLRACNPKKDGG
jgi:hypothetical protein